MSDKIADILKAQGRSQAWLARQLGINRSTLNRYLNGSRQMPRELIERTARILSLPASLLLSHAESVPTGDDNEPSGTYHADDNSAMGDGNGA